MDEIGFNTRNGSTESTDGVRASSRACHVCLFYPRAEIGERIVPRVEEVVRKFRPAANFEFYMWPYDVLDHSPFSGRVRASMDIATVVAVATDENSELPGPLCRWLDEWQAVRSECSDRLVALFHGDSARCPSDRRPFRRLSEFVASSGVGFVWCGIADEPLEQMATPHLIAGS